MKTEESNIKAVVEPELYCDLFLAFVYKNITESLNMNIGTFSVQTKARLNCFKAKDAFQISS